MARSKEEIKAFLEGRNPMKRVIAMECGYQDNEVSIIYRNEEGKKMIRKEGFYPFVWAKGKICKLMCNGDREYLKKLMAEYHIKCDELNIFDENGLTNERMQDGYRYMFHATRPTCYSDFLRFFQRCGTPVFARKSKKYEKLGLDGREFLQVSPVEQFMIYSGMRLFKDYDNYDDLVRMVFDIETEGLDPKRHAISQIGVRLNKGKEKIISIKGEGAERKKNEYQAIKQFYQFIGEEKPDVIAGHNSENFDHPFIEERFRILGGDPLETSRRFIRGGIYKRNKEAVLKLGGEVEYYKPTIIWGTNVLDSLHAVRRAQAIDSNMKSANLKYATKYIKMEKENRVYVDGSIINETWLIKDEVFAFNEENGDWYRVDDEHPLKGGYELKSGEYIVERYLLDDLYETDMVELKFNESNFLINKFIPTTFTRACTMGTAGIWKLIMLAWSFENKLAIPAFVAKRRFVGGLSRLLCVGYVAGNGIVKLDYNSLYPSIIITWCIETGVDISKVMVSLLAFVLGQREHYKELKGNWGDEAERLAAIIKDNENLTAEEKHDLLQKIKHAKAEKVANDKKQLPFKIFGNSFFGAFGNSDLFPFGDCDVAEKVTCIGRQSLRLMIHHFATRQPSHYQPLVGDTDGFNFSLPDSYAYTEEHPYIGKGYGRNVKKGEKYVGLYADVAEFEDMYFPTAPGSFPGKTMMGLGVDEVLKASINYSRKNYSDLIVDKNGKEELKLVGNTIKSKKMPGYIEEFLGKANLYLLHGQGKEFIEWYYEHLSNIYNYRIPLKQIALKGKIKVPVEEYKRSVREDLTKAGTKKSRQAWYELAIQNDLHVDVGDTVYYINTGSKKGDSDVVRTTSYYAYKDGEKIDITKALNKSWNAYKKKFKETNQPGKALNLLAYSNSDMATAEFGHVSNEDDVQMNCILLPQYMVESDMDFFCEDIDTEYNVVKYIDQFNKRIKPLTVCFDRSMRDRIRVDNPSDRGYFTDDECKLVSGQPFNEGDQDTYEALMTMDRREVEFWDKIGEVPPFVKEIGMDWDKIVADNRALREREKTEQFERLNSAYLKAIDSLTSDEVDDFWDDRVIPKRFEDIVHLAMDETTQTVRFYFNELPDMTPTTGGDIVEDIVYVEKDEEEVAESN